MTKEIEKNLMKVPILNILVKLGKKIAIPGLNGMSLYDLLELYIIGIVKGALTSRAGGIAFSFFMALFPFLLFVLTLIPYVPIEGFQEDFVAQIEHWLPPNTSEAVQSVIKDIANNKYGGLLSFGFLTSIFLMTNGVNSIFGGFEYSYHIKEMRSVIRQYLIALGTSIMLSILLLTTIAFIAYLEIGVQNLQQNGWLSNEGFWIRNGSIALFIFMIYLSVSILYHFGTKEVKHLKFFSPGALFTTVLTLLMFYLFGIYVIKFSKYNELYGSIGTLLILMLFVWLNSIILLLGFELNASLNRLRKRQLPKK
ncbi:YihY/virulence factor BrkB family protein [Aureivirga sp. CE67]|uniref:YihY/virulence factor BrkB family protein n=1 Tax=Aureivirga sp. CE67 TaxID=1788983 RepID=UPI0018CBBDA6|nr:YihY/virulence factor BrkB family protein [Aureivirga sp. CE67]